MLKLKRSIPALATLALGLHLIFPVGAQADNNMSPSASFSDIKGHWAQQPITEWVEKGYVKGYQDGTFKPDTGISRAEFMTLANRALGVTDKANISFSDVKSGQWFYEEVAKAQAANYIAGYSDGTMKPERKVSRQEVAVMFSKMAKLNGTETALSFKDRSSIPAWSQKAIAQVVAKGFMSGYPDQTFQPVKAITRAEAIVTLNKLLTEESPGKAEGKPQDVTYDQAGTYGPESGATTVEGSVRIEKSGVTLRNTIINGDLLISEAVGEGDVQLVNVTVKGTTTVQGGGANSVEIKNSSLGELVVNKKQGNVRIVAQGNTDVQVVELKSGAKLEEKGLTKQGFKNIVVSSDVPENATLSLSGSFDSLDVHASQISVNLTSGTIQKFTVKTSTADNKVTLSSGTTIKELTLEASVAISGQGNIEVANIKAVGVSFEKQPVTVNESLPTGAAGGGAGGATVVPTSSSPAAANLSLSGNAFSGSGTDLSLNVSKGTQIHSITADVNVPSEVQLISLRNANGDNFVGLLPTTTATVQAGTQQTINLVSMLGIGGQVGDDGVSGASLSTLLNGSNTGTVSISIKLTNVSDRTKSTTYNLTLYIQ